MSAAATGERARRVERRDGYLPLREYAAIGDGRTIALVGSDGSVDWLCLPDVDSPSVFGRLLDAAGGGHFSVTPVGPFAAERSYQADSNVLETTFHLPSGSVRLTDALTLRDERGLEPQRELVRRVEGLAGTVRLRWELDARFGYAERPAALADRHGVRFATAGADALTLGAWSSGRSVLDEAELEIRAGERVVFGLAGAHGEPAVLPRQDDCERRLAATERWWPTWSARIEYDGAFAGAVTRSALALKLLVYAPSGAMVAAATTSLPEEIGGLRNWDYRYTWLRDAGYTLAALLRIGVRDEAHAFFWWLMHALRLTLPELGVLYRVNGRRGRREEELRSLAGYRGSKPVRIGNGASDQLQLDVYGTLLDAIWIYVEHGGRLDRISAKDVAGIADHVCQIWPRPDAGIWEVRGAERQFVHSKGMCWVALDRACTLAGRGAIPDGRDRWGSAAREIREFVDEHGWDDERRSYVRATDLRGLDAALLGLCLTGFAADAPERLEGTIDAVARELAGGTLVRRYTGEDGLVGEEGAFVATSFWLAEAYARARRVDDAERLMRALVAETNDVGLLSEEIDPATHEFLGNMPQALSHLALINAALAIDEARRACS